MSTRIVMAGLGFVLVTAGGALAASRALQAGPIYPATVQVSASLVYTVAAVGVAVGALMWLLTPQSSRRRRRHVALDRNPLANAAARPAGASAAAGTASTNATPRAPGTGATGTVGTAVGSSGDHPADRSAAVPAPDPTPPAGAAVAQASVAGAHEPPDPRSRIEELAAEANRLKVEYALGRLSAHGYKAALNEIDNERSALESAMFQASRGAAA